MRAGGRWCLWRTAATMTRLRRSMVRRKCFLARGTAPVLPWVVWAARRSSKPWGVRGAGAAATVHAAAAFAVDGRGAAGAARAGAGALWVKPAGGLRGGEMEVGVTGGGRWLSRLAGWRWRFVRDLAWMRSW
jgi:hypothetical protein